MELERDAAMKVPCFIGEEKSLAGGKKKKDFMGGGRTREFSRSILTENSSKVH